tara:strand:+ start:1952 stop:2533 length:582 start_codon:yes stop_codon:yes gene_type:complete
MRVYPSQEKITVNHDSQPLLLNSNNPYVTNENEPLLQNPISRISIPSDLINKAIQVEKLTCPVKVICFCDIFMNTYYFFVNPIIGGILCIVSINGYLATIYYKRSLMFCYLIYQYLQVCGRLTTLIIAIDYAVQPVSNTTTNNTMVAFYNPVVSPILLGVMLLLQIYIAYFVTKFYKLLPNKEELERVRFTII